MNSVVTTAVIAGGTGIVSGALSSLVAPWAQWGVEKRRIDRARKAELLQQWRDGLTGYTANNPGAPPGGFMSESWFLSLRPHLCDEVRDQLDMPTVVPDVKHYFKLVQDEIEEIHDRWKLP